MPPFFRILRVLALAGALCSGLSLPVAAQAPAGEPSARVPSWVIPALRLVSATHVEPTTGVVLADSGLVLVPLAFGAEGDEIVVLDGGTDIVRNGRPARLERAFPELGLKVLSVPLLSRRGAPLSAQPLAAGSTITLAAFPPAERIEEGAPPLRETAVLSKAPDGDDLTAEPALPNVTGALLDDCGQFAGYSVADGVQTVAPAAGTQYRLAATLQSVLQELGLETAGHPCVPADPTEADTQLETETPAATPEVAAPVEQDPAQPVTEPPAELAAPPTAEAPPEFLPPFETGTPEPAAPSPAVAAEESGTTPVWLTAALMLLVAGLVVHRIRVRRAAAPADTPAGDDPEAAQDQPVADPRGDDDASPQDDRLVLRGQYADGRSLQVAAQIDSRAINLEIGRGNADLVLDSGAVSRRHARLGGTGEALTLADLGSSNGSSINGVPCLEGEVMYVEPGDTVILGDVRFVIEFESGTAGNSAP